MSESALKSEQPSTGRTFTDRKKQQAEQQKRQLLSCTKCRERKVKCDRTKPCSACCARGAPKQCEFVAEGGDYAPIQQSYELKRLRAENLKLRERLRMRTASTEDDDGDLRASPDYGDDKQPSKSHKRRSTRQKHFQGSEWSDSIYFGSPGLANVINEFANINLTPNTQSLAHMMPRGLDMYAPGISRPYPFATMFSHNLEASIPQLLRCLPATKKELFDILEGFEKRVPVCSFPDVPREITRHEVERFLEDPNKNAQTHPDLLGLLFAALAIGSQQSVWDRSGEKWVAGAMDTELHKGDVFIAAAKQALRIACFTSRPTLLGIQALIMIGPYLTNSGRFLDAWTLFGTTIRMAQSIGLHRHPKYLDPAPPTQRECQIRQQLWWWMLHMDQQYSMTLGRPLGISGIGDCPSPHELAIDTTHLRFGEWVRDFTVLARQILSSDRLTNTKIDEFTDSLRGRLETMPEALQFNENWLDESTEIPEWPLGATAAAYYCQTHNYMILLNRQRFDKHGSVNYTLTTPLSATDPFAPSFSPVSGSMSSQPSSAIKSTLRGRALVLSSAQDLLTAFLFFYHRLPPALICWTLGQQSFNACMILILDALETRNLDRIDKVERAYVVFVELQKKGVHKLAELAVERISLGLSTLANMTMPERPSSGRDSRARRRGNHGHDIDWRRIDVSEAKQGEEVLHDTVMGNTGMLLLEDPGLQSFVPEAFVPFKWVMAGGTEENAGSVRFNEQEQGQHKQGEITQQEVTHLETLNEEIRESQTSRFSEELQGVQGSAPGSAPLRYATFDAAPTHGQGQPQGPTPPTSLSSMTLAQQHHSQLQGAPLAIDNHSSHHYRHNSYPSLQHSTPTPLFPLPPHKSPQGQQRFPNPAHEDQPTFVPHFASRAGWTSSQPPLQNLPEFTAQPFHQAGNPSVHPSWAARPAAPLSSVSEPVLTFSHVSSRGQAIPAFPQATLEQETSAAYQYPLYEMKPGEAALAGTAEGQMDIDRWRNIDWLGTSGAG
ncbi:fungal-specific transcription factor domain-containing protein [Lophiotrema nucula]|uniref:Fungal-specific transcription factor domain-containing protein n=1 Tax=Lophiotrema nucula TaxID=690887 RepID=A0A6A5YV42_9PLEO|nr:fungal-specific transcription factor domain-containing protein [Lophiotrema nucula]